MFMNNTRWINNKKLKLRCDIVPEWYCKITNKRSVYTIIMYCFPVHALGYNITITQFITVNKSPWYYILNSAS
jgi:hypothetical protein